MKATRKPAAKAARADKPVATKSSGYKRGGELEVVVHQRLYTEEGRDGRETVLRLVSYVNNGKASKNSPMLEFREFYPSEKDGSLLAGKTHPIPAKLIKALFLSKKNERILQKMGTIINDELANNAK